MTNTSIKLLAASAIALTTVGASSVLTSPEAFASSVTHTAQDAKRGEFEITTNPFKDYDSAVSFSKTTLEKLLEGQAYRSTVLPSEPTNPKSGYEIITNLHYNTDTFSKAAAQTLANNIVSAADAAIAGNQPAGDTTEKPDKKPAGDTTENPAGDKVEKPDEKPAGYFKGQASWQSNSTGWWYQNADGTYPVSQWQQINGIWYYFNESGYMVANVWIGNYYLGDSGAMLTNTTTPDGYVVGSDGAWVQNTGSWQSNSTGWWYQNADGSYPANEWQQINGSWYYFNESGYMVASMWIGNYYLGENGSMLTNTTTPDGYVVDENGLWIA